MTCRHWKTSHAHVYVRCKLSFHTVGVVGFEQEEYTVNEGDLFLEVCLILFMPSNFSLVEPLIFVVGQSNPITADGKSECVSCLIRPVC